MGVCDPVIRARQNGFEVVAISKATLAIGCQHFLAPLHLLWRCPESEHKRVARTGSPVGVGLLGQRRVENEVLGLRLVREIPLAVEMVYNITHHDERSPAGR